MKSSITRNEFVILSLILDNEYNDRSEPGTEVWTEIVCEYAVSYDIKKASLGGVIASLIKKGLAYHNTCEKKDDCIAATKDALTAMHEYLVNNELTEELYASCVNILKANNFKGELQESQNVELEVAQENAELEVAQKTRESDLDSARAIVEAEIKRADMLRDLYEQKMKAQEAALERLQSVLWAIEDKMGI